MKKKTKRSIFKLSIIIILVVGTIVFVRDWNGARLLVLSPKILKYQAHIKRHAAKNQLDWKLITAVIVQESGFNEHAESSAGAKGLMQLMPETAKELGVIDPYDAEKNIAGATRYLRNLYDLYPDSSHQNRIRITLASYNGGRGHVKDAQKIALHLGNKPNKWMCIYTSLGLLTEKEKELHTNIWETGLPPHGYFRGYNETRQYVKRVMEYYERLCYFSDIVRPVKKIVNF